MKIIIAILSICFLPAISHAWFDETHLAIPKAAGYSKWYNAAAADVAKLTGQVKINRQRPAYPKCRFE